MYSAFLLSLILIINQGCGGSGYLNRKNHQFSQKPQNVIFAQIEGLGVTHMGALRFGIQNDQDLDYLSSFSCSGVVWPQNLYTMRPTAFDSMNAQIIGSKGLQGSCEDFDSTPFWQRFLVKNKQVVILEIDSDPKNTLEGRESCNKKSFLSGVTLLKMSSKNSSQKKPISSFNYKNKTFPKEGVYYDLSCGEKLGQMKCRSSVVENIRYVLENVFNKNKNVIFVIRDFRYKKLLKRKQYARAFKHLHSIITSISANQFAGQTPQNLLTLATGVNSTEIEFPNSRRGWVRLIKENKSNMFRYSGLQSLALAKGASAENFCGSFFDSEIVERIFFHHERDRSIGETFQGLIEW